MAAQLLPAAAIVASALMFRHSTGTPRSQTNTHIIFGTFAYSLQGAISQRQPQHICLVATIACKGV